MLNLSYSKFKNLSWVNWLDPLSHVNQKFDKKIFKEIEFCKIKLNSNRSKIIENLSNEILNKRKFIKEILKLFF